MSTDDLYSIAPIEVALDRRLTLRQLRVLLALFSFRDRNTNTFWPGVDAVAELCSIPPDEASDIVHRLMDLGWISAGGSYRLDVPMTDGGPR